VVTTKKPVIFTNKQVATLLGSAMSRYEREQAAAHGAFEPDTNRKKPSVVPLRGFCMIAYTTLMRPETNFDLCWSSSRSLRIAIAVAFASTHTRMQAKA